MPIRIKRVSALVSLCLAQAAFCPLMALGQEAQFDMDILKTVDWIQRLVIILPTQRNSSHDADRFP